MDLGFGEIVVILVIVLLLFGPSKLPKLGEGLGSAMANFRKAMRGEDDDAGAKRAADAQARALPEAQERAAAPAPAADEKATQPASPPESGGPGPSARA